MEQRDGAERDFRSYAGNCQSLTLRKNKTEGVLASYDFDIAQGDILKGPVTARQEWEFRKMLSAELRVLPSQANGWRGVIEGRASTARTHRPEVQKRFEEETKETDAACAERDEAEKRIIELRREPR